QLFFIALFHHCLGRFRILFPIPVVQISGMVDAFPLTFYQKGDAFIGGEKGVNMQRVYADALMRGERVDVSAACGGRGDVFTEEKGVSAQLKDAWHIVIAMGMAREDVELFL